MIEFEGKKFLNEQEAYLYCMEQIKIIKQSLGNALPDPIQGPQGEPGATGGPGPEGPRGTGIFGCTAVLPSPTAYKEGDLYVLFSGDLYKKINGEWILQTNLKGPQGAPGLVGGTEVVANPVSSPTDNLYKVSIDGTVYDILSSTLRTYLDNLQNYFEYDSGNEEYTLEKDASFLGWATFEGSVDFNSSVTFNDWITVKDTTLAIYNDAYLQINSLSKIVDDTPQHNPIVICENLNDKNGNARFIEDTLTMEAISGFTWKYCKYSLSGSHLMIVFSGTIESGTTIGYALGCNLNVLPNYVKSKIVTVYDVVVNIKNGEAYNDSWVGYNFGMAIYKYSDNDIPVYVLEKGVTAPSKLNFRIQFDLLIDMEQ